MSVEDAESTSLDSFLNYHEWSFNPSDENNNNKNEPDSILNENKHYPIHPLIQFHTIQFSNKSVYIWIGDNQAKLDNISCSMKTPYQQEPVSIELLAYMNPEEEENFSTSLACKLSKKLNKQVFVSFNIAPELQKTSFNETNLILLIEKHLFQQLKKYPQYFK
jgi:hypothetical protein